MTLMIVLLSAFILSIAFHFVGVYADAKKTVWVMIVLLWAAAINIAMSEVKPKGYAEIEKIKGQYKEVDLLIEKSMPNISIYEMLEIKNKFNNKKIEKG
ncbi:MAG: hypothetical protein QM497_06010 [Sulfurimonas sp.]